MIIQQWTNVTDRSSLADFIRNRAKDFDVNGRNWENKTIGDLLESLANQVDADPSIAPPEIDPLKDSDANWRKIAMAIAQCCYHK